MARRSREDLTAFARYVLRTDRGKPLVAARHHGEWTRLLEDEALSRLLIIAPPGHAKSTWCSIAFPAWYLGRQPERTVLLISATQTLAETFSLAVRDIVENEPRYRRVFPHVVPDRKRGWAADSWYLRRRNPAIKDPSLAACGVEGPIISRRSDLVIVDDPVKGPEDVATSGQREKLHDWFRQVVTTRLKPGGRRIVIMTRWHHDDLASRLMREGGWRVCHFPAIDGRGRALWPEMFPVAVLEQRRKELGTWAFEALYQGRPTPAEGNLFRREWFRYFEGEPAITTGLQVWDTAISEQTTADYSACVTLGVEQGTNRILVLDVFRARLTMPDLERAIVRQYELYRPQVIGIEDRVSGTSAIQLLTSKYHLPIVPVRADKDKIARAQAAAPFLEGGQVALRAAAQWLEDFEEELCQFPQGAHDDQVDAFVYALLRLRQESAPVGQALVGGYSEAWRVSDILGLPRRMPW
jgi:predicted phage terminase large subunit-like protein